MTVPRIRLCVALVLLWTPLGAGPRPEDGAVSSPLADVDRSSSALRSPIERYVEDLGNVERFWDIPMSQAGRSQREVFLRSWRRGLDDIEFASLSRDGQVDWLLLRNQLDYELRSLEVEEAEDAEVAELVPFWKTIAGLEEARRRGEPVDAPAAATALDALSKAVAEARRKLGESETEPDATRRTLGSRAARRVRELAGSLERWHRFHAGYDPLFTWWAKEPYEAASKELDSFARFLRKDVAGVSEDDDETIIGNPIGRDALLSELAHEMVPYTPEELVEIANREFAWCDREMERAARELGFDDDWRAAQDHVKSLHVEPGKQPQLIRELAQEAVDFLEARDLLTIPALCKETWRMEMMSAERQRVNPYFTGGEVISVSFPTDEMSHADKLMSMRGNNVHFSRATVQHELIPGHHLQLFMMERYRTHRKVFRTPFFVEGWALYWEMRLWDLGFPKTAEDRVGMLFWRKHRCARIIFSLSFHLGTMSAEECIDFLVERVGHERRNATAEVRRSVIGGYSPLYQAAYMLGGLQLRALHRELVEGGAMSEREFHDAVLRQGAIPIEMVRAGLSKSTLDRDWRSSWRFADE